MHTGELLVHNLESSDQFSSYTCQMMHTLTRKVTTSTPANIAVHGKTRRRRYDGGGGGGGGLSRVQVNHDRRRANKF